MAQPTSGDLHVNFALSNISIAYLQEDRAFIADRVFPIVPVEHQSNIYYTYDRDAWFRDDSTQRAPGTETAGTGWTVSNTTYNALVYGLHTDINEQTRRNADSVFQLDRDGTMLVTKQMQLRKEKTWATNYFGNVWTGLMTGTASTVDSTHFLQWNLAGSTPIEDVQTQILAIEALTGYRPNKLVLGPYTYLNLVNNPEIIDRVKYVQKGFLTEEILATAFGVDEVLVARATQNTATEKAALSMSFVYGKGALLVYAAPNPGLMIPSAGYTFAWTNFVPYLKNPDDASRLGGSVRIRKYPLLWLDSDRIEGEMAWDMKLVSADLGCYFATAVA